jgi:hypothetical protein
MKKIIILVMFVCTSLFGSTTEYMSSHVVGDPARIISLPCEASSSSKQAWFVNPVWAVEVLSIECDGVVISPDKADISYDDPNFRIVEAQAGMVYQFRTSDLVVATRFTLACGSYELVRYKIPSMANVIIARYRIRMPNGKVGGNMVMTSVNVNNFGNN